MAAIRQMRKNRGSTLLIGLALLFILIPLGLVAYDISMIRQQQNQLKAATDAAALAAATWVRDAENSAGEPTTVRANAQKIALPYFRSNALATGPKYSGSLETAASANSDISGQQLSRLGESKFYLEYDSESGRVTAHGAFCVQPSLLSFVGLYTLHARSVAGAGSRVIGDVCFVIDTSASMAFSTPSSRHVVRAFPLLKKELSEKRLSSNPALIRRFAVPAAVALINGDEAMDAAPNKIVTGKGEGVQPFGAAGYRSFNSNQIPNPHYIAFAPSPNPNNYHPAGTPPLSIIPSSTAPRLSIDADNTPLLFALLNDFASRRLDEPIPTDVFYPDFPKWPPVNPTKRFTYAADAAGSPELDAGVSYDGSDPLHLPYPHATKVRIKTYSTYTIPEVMTLVLLAAKLGYLEDPDVFQLAPPEIKFPLNQYFQNVGTTIPLQRGYQREYNKLALTQAQALATQVAIIHEVIDTVSKSTPDAHWSLVNFNDFAAGEASGKPPSNEQSPGSGPRHYDWKELRANGKLQTAEFFQTPLIPLDANRANAREVLRTIDESTVRLGTNTPQGLREGMAQLKGPGHRGGQSQTLILMTDGMPTEGGSLKVVKPSKTNPEGLGNIKLIIVGLFEGNYACPNGPNFCIKLKKAAGANAELLPIKTLTKNCGKVAGDPAINLLGDAKTIADFIVKALSGGGDVGLIE